MEKMKILVTGAAGFIGSATAAALARRGHTVTGIDNINSYYDPRLKLSRLRRDGIPLSSSWPETSAIPAAGSFREEVRFPDVPYAIPLKSTSIPGLTFIRLDIADREALADLREEGDFDIIINLAAQAGVRYSLENPYSYVESNLTGFVNLLEFAREAGCRHFIYASSSSVYGANAKVPFSEEDVADSPVSLYAATKRSDELIASAYTSLYRIPLTGLRFFTVYGPWGRPDMAPMLFSEAILARREISLFNNGDMSRDFTYIDDIVEGIVRVAESEVEKGERNAIYNIGRGEPTQLRVFVSALERALGRKAICREAEMQPGDVKRTWADTAKLRRDFGYCPSISIEEGTRRLAAWLLSTRLSQPE